MFWDMPLKISSFKLTAYIHTNLQRTNECPVRKDVKCIDSAYAMKPKMMVR